MIGHETIDLRYVEQLVDSEQLNTLGQIVRFLEEEIFDGRKTLGQAIEQVENILDKRACRCVRRKYRTGKSCKTAYTGNLCLYEPLQKAWNRQEREGIEYESHCRKCKKNTVKDVGRHGYQTNNRQDQGDII